MHKVSKPYKIKTYKGWIVRWFISGVQKYKTFPNLVNANAFRKKKYNELNYEDNPQDKTFDDVVAEYFLQRYDLKQLSAKSKKEPVRVLNYFRDLISPFSTSDITQDSVNHFVASRIKDNISRWTVNKDIGCFKAFLNWLVLKNYHKGHIELSFVKAPPIIKKALTNDEIRALLKACPTECWRMRLLLSLTTGLRAGDIDSLQLNQIDLKHSTLASVSRKTSKVYPDRPIPLKLIPALSKYIKSLPNDVNKLLIDRNIQNTWNAIRKKAKLPQVTRQDLRITFSTLIQKLGSIGTAQKLLEHSDKRTTETFYTDYELILRWKVEQLPVKKWLK